MDKFLAGWFLGVIVTGVCLIIVLPNPEDTIIESNKRIVPEWKLITEGKKVDTIYIYKNK